NAARTCGSSSPRFFQYSRAGNEPMRLPRTISCAPVSCSGLSSTGFMAVWGSMPQASACCACARPISPPSAVTAALLDMFCGLNGATLSPRILAARHSPATSSDLPTLEPAPWIISARMGSELDARLGLNAGPERMLDQRHLGDEVGDFDQLFLGVAAGQNHVCQRRFFFLQEGHDVSDIEIIIAQRDIDFVEQHQPDVRVPDQFLGLLPAGAGGGNVAGAVLGLPGKALAHGVELAKLRKM